MTAQSAAIPYRRDEAGRLQVLLVTSRRSKRWIVPKGKVRNGTLPSRAAEREAFEEAGVLGTVEKQPLATYWQGDALPGHAGTIPVQAFALEVITELAVWDEMEIRQRRWFPLGKAVRAVRDPQLRGLLRAFKRRMR